MQSEQKYNVLIISATLGIGGLETYIVNVLKCLDRERFRCTVVYGGGRDDYKEEIEKQGVDVLVVPYSYAQIPYMCRIGRVMVQRRIDILCDFGGDFAAPALLAAKLLGVRSRIAMYRSSRDGFRSTFLKDIYVSVSRKMVRVFATRIIGNSSKVLDSFYPTWKNCNKYAVVHNGIPLDTFTQKYDKANVRIELGIPTDAFVIGHVGRLHESKNHMVILDCFAKIRNDCANAYLLLVGDGPLRKRIEFDLAKMGISNRVVMAGQRRDIAQMLSAMDIFLYPSIYEGMPTALVEAMAAGLPVVASNIGEIAEIVPPESHKQLYAPYDVDGMTTAIYELCTNKCKRQQMGQRLKEWAIAHYSIETSLENLCRHWLASL